MKETEYYSEKKKGLVGTIIFHAIVLILLLIFGFFTPLPLPGEEGILVNFGNTDNGLGDREPAPARRQQQQTPPPPPQKQEPKASTPPAQTTPPPAQQSKPEPAKEVAMTQDYEKTAAIDAAEKKKREEADRKKQEELAEQRKREQEALKKKQAEEAQAKALADAEAKRKAEAEAKAKAEAEAKAKAEAERKAREEAERKQREEEQRKISEINSRTQGAFANSGNGSGGTGSGDGKSQGVTFPGGNQGVPTGDPNANQYGQGGSGSGNQGDGSSFDLDGFSIVGSLPRPKYPGNEAGKVVVRIIVDRNGNVTSAEPGYQGTDIMDKNLWNEAQRAALKAKFKATKDVKAFQQGTITYRFVLD
ncbi:cell envelope integrity protein TolA [Maribellus sediminis]|uniref:cell envelope integrity protein TolA n=1 Tax=Maribellus sediminis TaxID=2696285 RepID=UPI0014305753|nr:cell envelope integrity protein TolA [Maribellus sediminis]